MADESMQSLGGKARAEALTPEQRSEIAQQAAEARWGIQKATHTGELHIGSVSIRCAVLEDGTRVLTQRDFLQAIGRSGKPAAGRGSADFDQFEKGSPLVDSENLKPFVPHELATAITPLQFRVPEGPRAWGYRAELLPQVCEVYLQARDAGALRRNQLKFAAACEVLIRGLARVGIVALVDEATGYQEIRDRLALQKLLDRYLTDEWAKWSKTFPDEFYRHLFRLKSIEFPSAVGKPKPSYVGHWTNDVVYSRLAPGVLKALREKNPRTESGGRARKHHQHLTRDYGHPALKEHLSNVVFLMRSCRDFAEFKRRLDVAAPKCGDTLSLDLGDA